MKESLKTLFVLFFFCFIIFSQCTTIELSNCDDLYNLKSNYNGLGENIILTQDIGKNKI